MKEHSEKVPEENDFCLRAKNEGFYVGFLQNSKILYKVGRSSISNVKIYLRTRNIILFYTTYTSSKYDLIVLVRHIIKTLISVIKTPSEFIMSIRAMYLRIYDFYKNFFYMGSIDKL